MRMNQKTKANGPRSTRSTFITPMSSALILWMPNTRTPRKRIGDNSRNTAHIAMPQTNRNGAVRKRRSLLGGFITLRVGTSLCVFGLGNAAIDWLMLWRLFLVGRGVAE